MKTVAVIPARLKSTRFPNKIIQKFNGQRIIDRVIENTLELDFIDDVVIATDNESFGKEIVAKHRFVKGYYISDACCGTHRVYQFYKTNPSYKYYVSIPCDEPLINSVEINKTISNINESHSDEIVTLYTNFFCEEDLHSPLSCKIVANDEDYMIYNSRAVVPILKSGSYLPLEDYKKHLGIFIFHKNIFKEHGMNLWLGTTDIESLEQNRFLQRNVSIKLYKTNHIGFGVDIPEQIKKLEERSKLC
jgi:3-deoxy-manno-octulosonate cytidylyltransferase (CMP-KDO synthetase)